MPTICCQAQIYKEDFLKERRDREQLKGKHGDLEEKFRKVHTELNALKSKVCRATPSQTCSLWDPYVLHLILTELSG